MIIADQNRPEIRNIHSGILGRSAVDSVTSDSFLLAGATKAIEVRSTTIFVVTRVLHRVIRTIVFTGFLGVTEVGDARQN